MRSLLATFRALPYFERERIKDTLLAAFGGACVIGALMLSGAV